MDFYDITWNTAIYQKRGLNDTIEIVERILKHLGWANENACSLFFVVDMASNCNEVSMRLGTQTLTVKRIDD